MEKLGFQFVRLAHWRAGEEARVDVAGSRFPLKLAHNDPKIMVRNFGARVSMGLQYIRSGDLGT